MYSRILVPLDSSTASLRGLDEAIRLAVLEGSVLRLVHVVEAAKYHHGDGAIAARDADLVPWMEEAGEQLLQQGRQRAEAAGVAAQTLLFTVRAADVADIVVEQARTWNAELIVMGTHGCCGRLGHALQGRTLIPVLLVHAAHAHEADVVRTKDRVAVAV
jgi:nucleotide-binding universal stress UspA family protein